MKEATDHPKIGLTADTLDEEPIFVAGRPYRSVLKPHLEFIRQQRRADKSWQEIADLLGQQYGVQITGRGVNRFFASMRRRTTWPLGMEPIPSGQGTASQSAIFPQPNLGLLGSKRGQKNATPSNQTASESQRQRSQLYPHREFIDAQRAAGESWRQIAEALAARGVQVSHQAVSNFYKRTRDRAARRQGEAGTSPSSVAPPPSSNKPLAGEDDYLAQMN